MRRLRKRLTGDEGQLQGAHAWQNDLELEEERLREHQEASPQLAAVEQEAPTFMRAALNSLQQQELQLDLEGITC